MWLFGAEIPDGYIIVVLGVVLPALFGVVAWVFTRTGNHDRDIAVMKERMEGMAREIVELKARRD